MLQVLICRVLAIQPDQAQPRGRRRGGARRRWQRTVLFEQIAAIGRACDILHGCSRRNAPSAPDTASELDQLFEEAAKYLDNQPLPADPPDDIEIKEYVPASLPT